MKRFLNIASDTKQRSVHYDAFRSLLVTGCTQCSGLKPMSVVSPRINVVWLSDGEGEARRKAGLLECSESLLWLLLLNGGQGAAIGRRACCPEQPAEGEDSVEGVAMPETSGPRGVVFGVPGGHGP